MSNFDIEKAVAARPISRDDAPHHLEPKRTRAKQQRAEDTRAALLATARRLFGENGYHATGTNEIVVSAQVTRGALYHHFRDKEDLFEAVCREVEIELTGDAQAATRQMQGRTIERMIASLALYLEILANRRETQRILLIDGPAVLGWERWRSLRSEHEYAGWVRTLELLTEQGTLTPTPVEPLALIITGAVNEASLAIAHASDRSKARFELTQALTLLIGGLVGGCKGT